MLKIILALLFAFFGADFFRRYLKVSMKSFLLYALACMILIIFVLIYDQQRITSILLGLIGLTLIGIGSSLAMTTESGMYKKLKSSGRKAYFLWGAIPTGLRNCKPTTTMRSGILWGILCILLGLGIVLFTGFSHFAIIYLVVLTGALIIGQSILYLE